MYSDRHSSVFITSSFCRLDRWACVCRITGYHIERTALILNSCRYNHELSLVLSGSILNVETAYEAPTFLSLLHILVL
jgi:hypothetical protein